LFQKAIWWLEGEEAIKYDPANQYMAAVVREFNSQGAAMADGGWMYNVYALNLTDNNGGNYQDQLVYNVTVPEPSLIVMFGICLATVSTLVIWRGKVSLCFCKQQQRGRLPGRPF
jgi:hypothetical protein